MNGELQPPRPSSRNSKDFALEIRQLETEGARLLTSTHTDNLGSSTHGYRQPLTATVPGLSNEKLSELTDISDEQRAIETLKAQLEAQAAQTEQLSRNFLGSKGFRYGSTGSLLDQLEIPPTVSGSSRGNGGGLVLPVRKPPLDFLNIPSTSSTLEQELRDARREVTDLRTRLTESQCSHERQRTEFRALSEDLHRRLQEVTVAKDNLLLTRQKEGVGQEALIQRLQSTVDQLELTNKTQEKTLLDLSSQLQNHQRESHRVETALNGVRGILLQREHIRGKPYDATVTITQQDLGSLVTSLQTCLSEVTADLEAKDREISRLANAVEDQKLTITEKTDQLTREHQQKMLEVSKQHETAMNSFSERSITVKEQLSALQDQIKLIQKECDDKLKVKQDHIADLDLRIQSLQQQHSEDSEQWNEKREGLERALDESSRELAVMKTERDDAVRSLAAVTSRQDDMQRTISDLTENLISEREKVRAAEEELCTVRVKMEAVTERLKDREQEVTDLRQVLTALREENTAKLHQAVSEVKREGEEKSSQQTSTLSLQLNAMTDKCQRLSAELEITKSHHAALTERHETVKTKYEALREDIICTKSQKEHATSLLKDRLQEIEKLTEQKEGFVKLMEERSRELSSLQMTKEKLTIQLEEREKNFLALHLQHEKSQEVLDITSKTSEELRRERDELNQRMNEKIIETEEIRRARDGLNKKLRHKDKRIVELEQSEVRVSEQALESKESVAQLTREKEGVIKELTGSRYEVANLKQQNETWKKKYEARTGAMGKELTRLKKQIKGYDSDLKLAKTALHSQHHKDDKAMKVAGKMQRAVTEKRGEIDTLQSRVRWLEDRMETLANEKAVCEDEARQLAASTQKSLEQNERLATELKSYVAKNRELSEAIKKLKAEADKARMKQATIKAQAEEFEQEVTRLKLQHKLNLKELERNGQLNRHIPLTEKTPVSSNQRAAKLGHVNHVTCAGDADLPVRDKPKSVNMSKKMPSSKQTTSSKTSHRPTTSRKSKHENAPTGCNASPDLSLTSLTSVTPDRKHVAEKESCLSPVSDLLTKQPHNETDSDDSTDSSDLDSYQFYGTSRLTGDNTLSSPHVSSDTQQLCARLEQKISSLTNMGGQLQRDNLEMARIMQQEDIKLKQAKKKLTA